MDIQEVYSPTNYTGTGDFPGGTVDRNLPANAGDTGLIPSLERFHMPQSNLACVPQLLRLRAATAEPTRLEPLLRRGMWGSLAARRMNIYSRAHLPAFAVGHRSSVLPDIILSRQVRNRSLCEKSVSFFQCQLIFKTAELWGRQIQ